MLYRLKSKKRSAWAEEREKARKEEVERRNTLGIQLENQGSESRGHLSMNKLLTGKPICGWKTSGPSTTGCWPRFLAFDQALQGSRQDVREPAAGQGWNPLRWPLLLSQAYAPSAPRASEGALSGRKSTHNSLANPRTQIRYRSSPSETRSRHPVSRTCGTRKSQSLSPFITNGNTQRPACGHWLKRNVTPHSK